MTILVFPRVQLLLLLSLICLPSVAEIPYRSADDAVVPSGNEWLLYASICFFVLLATVFFLKRFGFGVGHIHRSEKSLVVEQRLSLGGQAQLYVIRFNESRLLLAVSAQGVACLREDRDHKPHEADKRVETNEKFF